MSIRALLWRLAASSSTYAVSSRTVPEFEIHSKIEKKNALVNFDRGAVAGVISKDALDSIAGTTGDFPGAPVPAFIVFDESVPEKRVFQLANFQGSSKERLSASASGWVPARCSRN